MKARSGKYTYRGYTITNHGYYPPDRCVWWEAVKDGNADYHGHTLREVVRLIDEGFHADEVRSLKQRISVLEEALRPVMGINLAGIKKYYGINTSSLLVSVIEEAQLIMKEGENNGGATAPNLSRMPTK